MIPRVILGFVLAVVMVVVGVSTYYWIGTRQSKLAVAPLKPTAAQPTPHAVVLPGTLYFSQGGAIYGLSAIGSSPRKPAGCSRRSLLTATSSPSSAAASSPTSTS
jgi:hypothetical protein